jgi:hypothetical protein
VWKRRDASACPAARAAPDAAACAAGAAGRSVGVYLEVLLAGMLMFSMRAGGAQHESNEHPAQAEDLSCGAVALHQQHVGAAGRGGQWLKRRGGAQEEPTDDGRAIATAAPGPCDKRLLKSQAQGDC